MASIDQILASLHTAVDRLAHAQRAVVVTVELAEELREQLAATGVCSVADRVTRSLDQVNRIAARLAQAEAAAHGSPGSKGRRARENRDGWRRRADQPAPYSTATGGPVGGAGHPQVSR